MASLQARHSRSCPLYPWTPFARATKRGGCTCTPLYHVVLRHDGKLVREPVGANRKEAERALDARRGDIARRTYRIVDDIRFGELGDAREARASYLDFVAARERHELPNGVRFQVALPTPFADDDRLDVARFRAALEWWIASPLTGFVVLGSSGEAVLMDDEEGDRIVDVARAIVPRHRPLIAGTARESTRATIRATRRAAELGADAVLVRTPGFFKSQMTGDVFLRHYVAVADASPWTCFSSYGLFVVSAQSEAQPGSAPPPGVNATALASCQRRKNASPGAPSSNRLELPRAGARTAPPELVAVRKALPRR